MRIRWLYVLGGGFLAELLMAAVALPLNISPATRPILLYTIVPLCLAATFGFGAWVASKASGKYVLHGVLVGVVAAILYLPAFMQDQPLIYMIANGLKLVGGAAGGLLIASRRRAPRALA
jgi:hypothetical protein